MARGCAGDVSLAPGSTASPGFAETRAERAEIFISYARSTAAQAQAVAERSARRWATSVWLDDDLPAHRAYTDVIEERLRAATAVVVIWSAEAAKSEWVQSEADLARAGPQAGAADASTGRLPMPFDRIQCADLAGWTGDPDAPGWRKVLASIDDLIGRRRRRPRTRSPAAHAAPAPRRAAAGGAGLRQPLRRRRDGLFLRRRLRGDPADGGPRRRAEGDRPRLQLPVPRAGQGGRARRAALKATHVLDGSVRRSGNKVRIAANLIECERETTLWSDRFDRELSDVFALQDEIAAAVAAALKVAFAPAVQAETVDPAAYTLYPEGAARSGIAACWSLRRRARRDRAAWKRRPPWRRSSPAPGSSWRRCRSSAFASTRPGSRRRSTRAEVVVAAETALQLDPGLGGAHQALGQLEPLGRFAEREALHMKALAVAPNDPTVLTNASLFFTEVGRIHEALGYARQAYDLDPMYPWAANWYANMLGYAGRFAEARAAMRSSAPSGRTTS